MSEELEMGPRVKIGLAFFIGLLIGGGFIGWYDSKLEYRSPEELTTYIEEIMFNNSHMEDIQHSQIEAIIKYKADTMTLAELKVMYKMYGHLSRTVLSQQLNNLCYKKEWKE